MKKIVKKSVFFLLYFLTFSTIVNLVFLYYISKNDWNFSSRIASLRWEDPDYELLVLGASLPNYGVDTELLTEEGIKSYNLSLVGSSVQTCFVQIEEYLTNYDKKPRYVLLFVNSYLEAFDQEGIQPLVEFTMKDQKIDLKDVPISKFQWQTHEIMKKLLSKGYRSGYTANGQIRRNSVTPDNSEYRELKLDLDKYQSAVWIGRIAELCKQYGISFYVIDIPGVKETQNSSDVGPYTLDYGNGITAELYNLNSKEFCTFIDPQTDWSGLSHFNERGAAKFSKELLKIIRESS